MNEMLREIGDRLANKYSLYSIYKNNYNNNHRECPFYSEARGIEEALKVMGINFSIEFDVQVSYEVPVAVVVNGERFEVEIFEK